MAAAAAADGDDDDELIEWKLFDKPLTFTLHESGTFNRGGYGSFCTGIHNPLSFPLIQAAWRMAHAPCLLTDANRIVWESVSTLHLFLTRLRYPLAAPAC